MKLGEETEMLKAEVEEKVCCLCVKCSVMYRVMCWCVLYLCGVVSFVFNPFLF